MKNSRRSLIIVSMALLLAVVLAMGGVTFAKYVTATNVTSNSANVAKWGFTLSADASNIFGTKYKAGTGKLSVIDANGTLVVSANTDNVVAPGTTGSMTFSVHGTAEVYSEIKFVMNTAEVQLKDAEDNVIYTPIKWTLTQVSDAAPGGRIKTFDTLADVETYIEGLSGKIAANTNKVEGAQYEVEGDYTLTWAWAYEQNNEYDTYLGQIIAGTYAGDYTATTGMAIDLKISVEQIQG